jgi:hypothetical protein
MISIYTNPRLLLSTENNKKNICEAIKDEWLDAETIGECWHIKIKSQRTMQTAW